MAFFDIHKRPTSLDELVLYKDLRKALDTYMEQGAYSPILFHGTSGTGKTISAEIIISHLKKTKNYTDRTIESPTLLADKDINKIVKDLDYSTIFDSRQHITFFDEFHNLKKRYQSMLNIPIEKSNSQFIFCVNDIDKVISPIQSRCRLLCFNQIIMNEQTRKLSMLPHTNMTVDEYKKELFRAVKLYAQRDDVELTDDDLDECVSANPERLREPRYFLISLDAQLRQKQS